MDRLLKFQHQQDPQPLAVPPGRTLYELIPTMPEHRLVPLIKQFAQALSTAPEFSGAFTAAK